MPLLYHPRAGEVLICAYPRDMKVPEMIKARPVVVIAPKLKHRTGLATVVPLSTTAPRYEMPYHYRFDLKPSLPAPWDGNPVWAAGDHPMTVCFERLSLIKDGKDVNGKRKYIQVVINSADLDGVRRAVLEGMQLGHLWPKSES